MKSASEENTEAPDGAQDSVPATALSTQDPGTETSAPSEEKSRAIVRALTDDANLVNVRTFMVAARFLSFKAAARFLCLTPGAVSHRIAKLEDCLGFPLFRRLTRTISLTPEGQRLTDICLNAFLRFREEVCAQLGQDNFSSLSLYSHHSIAISWLIPRLADFYAQHPGVQLHVQTGNEPASFSTTQPVDVAIYYANGVFPGLESLCFMQEDIFPVCSPTYAKTHQLTDKPERLAACTLLADAAAWHFSTPMAEWQEWYGRHGLSLAPDTPMVSFDTSVATTVAACHHMGVAMGRRCIVQSMLDEGKLVAAFPALPPLRSDFGYYAVWPRNVQTPPKLQNFLHWLQACASNS